MSATPDPAAWSPESARNLRHDLRTPANHIIGYSELLLEQETEEGTPDTASLLQIQELGRGLLGAIDRAVDPSRSSATALSGLSAELRAALQEILDHCGALLTGDTLPETLHDLRRIEAAALQLFEMAEDISLSGPLEPPTSAAAMPGPHREGREHTLSGAATLLVVDDNEPNRDVLARRLERLGYGVVQAENGRVALEWLAHGTCDLVLLDILMPEMDGYQVLASLQANPGLRHLPVIVLSALDEIDSVVRCIEMGAEDYLPKPFNPVLLRARIGAALEKKRLRDTEVAYLRQVALVTDAATDVEASVFVPERLSGVAERGDALGQLARVFQRMAREVAARENRLKQQVQELRIEIDQAKKAREVTAITESDYFQSLRQRRNELRRGAAAREGGT